MKERKNLSNRATKQGKSSFFLEKSLVSIFVFSLLGGCQSSLEKAPPRFSKDAITSGYILDRLQTRANKIYSVKSFARTTFIGGENKQSLRQTLILRGNGSIRVDTYGLFGQALGVFVSVPGKTQFLDLAKGRVYSGADVKKMLWKLLGTQIDFQENLRIFVGHIPHFEFLKVEEFRLTSDKAQYILQARDTKNEGEVRLHIGSMTLLPSEMTRFENGKIKYFVQWQEYEKINSIDWPHLITLEFPERRETLRIKYKDPTLNGKISPEAFQLMPTASAN